MAYISRLQTAKRSPSVPCIRVTQYEGATHSNNAIIENLKEKYAATGKPVSKFHRMRRDKASSNDEKTHHSPVNAKPRKRSSEARIVISRQSCKAVRY